MSDETIPAPCRVYNRDDKGDPYSLRYAKGDPVPVDEAKQLGLINKKGELVDIEAEELKKAADEQLKAEAAAGAVAEAKLAEIRAQVRAEVEAELREQIRAEVIAELEQLAPADTAAAGDDAAAAPKKTTPADKSASAETKA